MKLFDWLKVSNRMKHLKAGALIFIAMLIFQAIANAVITSISGIEANDTYLMLQVLVISIVALVTTFIAMCSVEYIQKSSGYYWDWLDVLAGCLLGIVYTFVTFIASLFV